MKKYLATLTLLLLACIVCPAQQRIVKLMDTMERKSDVNATYTERRNNKHKMYRTTRVLEFNNKDYYKQLVDAFEAERNNTTTAVKSKDTYSFRFENENGLYTFTLEQNRVIMVWRSNKDFEDEAATQSIIINGVELALDYEETEPLAVFSR